MYTLFIDTHQNTKLALYNNDILLNVVESNEIRQSTIIIPLLNNLIDSADIKLKDINEILLVNGPGSFTGVRLGVTIGKTLAYALNIPIKCINAIELKAVMDDFKNTCYGIKDAKGFYLGELKEDNINLSYVNNSDVLKKNITTDVEYNYEKIIKYKTLLKPINPHLVNPLYVKKIEVEK